MTLDEVAKEFKVSRERMRLIEAKAIRKLQHPKRSILLKPFLTDDYNLDDFLNMWNKRLIAD